MNFEKVLIALRAGLRVQRENYFVEKRFPREDEPHQNGVEEFIRDNSGTQTYPPVLSQRSPWYPSETEKNATDWKILTS
jgi:hypothetical protein